jgi:hypothetical protein
MSNLSQDIISFVSILVDKLRTQWIVSSIDNTDPKKPIIFHEILSDYVIENDEEIELGYWQFVSGTGYIWQVVLSAKATPLTNNKIQVENPDHSDLSTVTTIRNLKPFFYHGTYTEVNKEIDTKEEIFSKATYPAVIVWEVIRQSFEADHTSILGNTPRLTMSFLDTTNKLDWTNDEQYQNVIDPMELYADKFIAICDKHPYLAKLNNFTYIKHTNWGKYVQGKGHVKYILDENLAGLNLEIDLPIKKQCLNKFAKI